MSKEPTLLDLKKALGIPLSSKFLGWLVHHPIKDEYLVTYKDDDFSTEMGWGLSPETGKKFKTLKKCQQIIRRLEIQDRAESVPAFDIGKQIVVGANRPHGVQEVSPFRSGLQTK